jgi:hypothetical protein
VSFCVTFKNEKHRQIRQQPFSRPFRRLPGALSPSQATSTSARRGWWYNYGAGLADPNLRNQRRVTRTRVPLRLRVSAVPGHAVLPIYVHGQACSKGNPEVFE